MDRLEQINTAWKRGYEAGLSGKEVRCPYDSPWLYGPWIGGFASGGEDFRSSRSLPGCDGFAATAGSEPSTARAA